MEDGWIQIISLFLANAGLVLWMRSESRSDWRHMDAKLDASLNGIREEMKDFHEKIFNLEKDFHDRLIKIEMDRK